jgi:hypothetical protein
MSWVDPHDCEICGHAKSAHDAREGCLVQLPGGSIMCPCTTYVGLTADATNAARLLGSKGGLSTASRMTPEARKARAAKAGRSRWDKAKAKAGWLLCSTCGHYCEPQADGTHYGHDGTCPLWGSGKMPPVKAKKRKAPPES